MFYTHQLKHDTSHFFTLFHTHKWVHPHTIIANKKSSKNQKENHPIEETIGLKKASDLERETDQSPPQQPSNHYHCNNHNHVPPKTTTTATNFSLIDQIRLRSGDHGRNSWLPPTPNSWLPHTPKSLSQIRSGYHRGALGDGADNSIEAARREW